MRIYRSLIFALAVLPMASAGWAQEAAGAPQPTAEHAALEAFVGAWSGEAVLEPGPFGPGGPMSWTEECSWFGGAGFQVVCESEGTGPMGPMKGLGITTFDAAKGAYTHYGVDSTGWSGMSEGSHDGSTWTLSSAMELGGTTYHNRFVMTFETPNRMTFTWSTSEDGESWVEAMTGSSEKQ